MKKIFNFVIIVFFIANVSQLNAVPAYPYPIKIHQPDGSYLTIKMKGDEFFHYYTTEDGFPIVKDENGLFNYAKIDENGKMTNSSIKARDKAERTSNETESIQAFTNNVGLQKINSAKRVRKVLPNFSKPMRFPVSGSPRSLVILVNFSDKSFVVSNPNTAFTNLLNQAGYSTNGGTGSAKDYFKDNSMETFIPQFDVVGPYNLSKSYSTYGKNDKDGNDQDPVQMIVDACTLASQNGVDFSIYDTDNDGYVDNVFVYYAGYNEAEGASSNTIWPHRWGVYLGSNYTGTATSITFNGKKIQDYACTSELKGSSGSNMCGIGTFCHEFGHVLGLVDFYATNNATHHTLSDWDIMDYGPYLNGGKTPPSYSSHERFYLKWLTPVELKSPRNVTLKALNTSNKAYIITQNGNSNLDGANPNPTEYFLLENRQNTGWDTYLPGHGMLITRVNYNAANWDNNAPNNDPNNMGVDIIEADGIATDNTLSGDPFPGTAAVTNYSPVLINGINIQKPITDIQEIDGVISCKFLGGSNQITPPDILDATNITDRSFVIHWESTTQNANKFYVTVIDYNGNKIIDKSITTQQSDTIYNLVSDRDYSFYVQAGENDSEDLSEQSETKIAHTLPYTSNKALRVLTNSKSGNILIFVPKVGSAVYVFNSLGQKVMDFIADSDIMSVNSLPKNQIYIIQSEKLRAKVLW